MTVGSNLGKNQPPVHTFLIDVGAWVLQGQWLDAGQPPQDIKGKVLIAWTQDDWFTMTSKLIFPSGSQPELNLHYRGKLPYSETNYAFVLQHSHLGRLEGVGLVGQRSIVQRFWVLGDPAKRGGFETFWQVSPNEYVFTCGLTAGNKTTNLLEATLTRQAT